MRRCVEEPHDQAPKDLDLEEPRGHGPLPGLGLRCGTASGPVRSSVQLLAPSVGFSRLGPSQASCGMMWGPPKASERPYMVCTKDALTHLCKDQYLHIRDCKKEDCGM